MERKEVGLGSSPRTLRAGWNRSLGWLAVTVMAPDSSGAIGVLRGIAIQLQYVSIRCNSQRQTLWRI